MSLVAYGASSDEESDYESEDALKAIIVEKPIHKATNDSNIHVAASGHISDDDEFVPATNDNVTSSTNSLSQFLPLPKNNTILDITENFARPAFTALPPPKTVSGAQEIMEEDDEFLHKKPSNEIITKPQKSTEIKKTLVKIIIPSLKNFQDVDKEMSEKAKSKNAEGQMRSTKFSGLLSLLPKAKSEQNFTKVSSPAPSTNTIIASKKPMTHTFVPDAVKHRRPATNTEDVDGIKINKKKISNQPVTKTSINIKVESDDSDGEENGNGDFFSFHTDECLPEVSSNEINALVAKKAAKIAETTSKYLNEAEALKAQELERMQSNEQQKIDNFMKRHDEHPQLNPQALQALVGGSSKRRRQQKDDIHVIDINSEQVLPNKEEWMRTALASSTTYQPTGVLVDEEPASGTRRKHQITYLAHKAKANEAELQAMWSANRQNRRATQSKYGF